MKSNVRYCYYWAWFSLGKERVGWVRTISDQTEGTCGEACGDLRPGIRLHTTKEMTFPGAGWPFPVRWLHTRSNDGPLWPLLWLCELLAVHPTPSFFLILAGLELGNGCLCLPGGRIKGICAWPLKEKFFKVYSLVILIDFCDCS